MQTIKMDFQSQSTPPVVPVMQYDAQSRFIGITLYNGGVPYEAPEGASYTVQYRGPGANNMGWYDTIQLSSGTRKAVIVDSASKNVVTLELAEQALRVNGNVFVNLCVVTNTGYMLKTFPILCRVTGAAFPDTVAVQSFFYVTGITSEQWMAYVTACQDAQKRAEDAAAKFVIDPTLSVEGKAADAKATGDAVGQLKEDKLDKRKMFIQTNYDVEDGVISTSKQIYLSDIYKHCVIDNVSSGQYAISCFSINSSYVGAFVEKVGQSTIILFSDDATAHTREIITIPEAYNGGKVYINGRTDRQMIEWLEVSNEPSEEFWKEYNDLKNLKHFSEIGLHLKSDESCDIFIRNYEENRDMLVQVLKKGINKLPDISRIGSVENKGDEVLIDSTGLPIRQITGGTTDYLSPSVVYAVNNLDGDFPDMTSGKYTGGWHGYNNASQNSTPTAKNVSYKVFCDEKELLPNERMRGSKCVIDIVNQIQASNTEKSDGSGRNVVEQHFRLSIDKNCTIQVDCEITALEDVHYQLYFGLSVLHTMPENVFFVGSRVNRGGQVISKVNYSEDKFCTLVKQIGENDTLEMGIDTDVDLGMQYANLEKSSFIMSNSKSYAVLINCDGNDSNRLSLKKGEKVFWRGYYKCYPTV